MLKKHAEITLYLWIRIFRWSSIFKVDFWLKEMSYIYQLYGIIEKLNEIQTTLIIIMTRAL